MNRQFCRCFGTFSMVDEGQDSPGDEENDDNRLIIICARVDPRFKDEAVNTKERKILLCIEKQHLSSVMLKRTKINLFNHYLTIIITLYPSITIIIEFNNLFNSIIRWRFREIVSTIPPWNVSSTNYSQIQLFIFN